MGVVLTIREGTDQPVLGLWCRRTLVVFPPRQAVALLVLRDHRQDLGGQRSGHHEDVVLRARVHPFGLPEVDTPWLQGRQDAKVGTGPRDEVELHLVLGLVRLDHLQTLHGGVDLARRG